MSKRILSCLALCGILMMTASCGKDDDDGDNGGDVVNTTPPQQEEEDTNTNTETNGPIRYLAAEQVFSCGMGFDCNYSIRADFNRRPLIITANFQDYGEYEQSESEEQPRSTGECTFQVKLTEKEAGRLEKLADKIRTCSVRNDMIMVDGPTNELVLTGKDGDVTRANKKRYEDVVDEIYICRGRSKYYNYIRQLVKGEVPKRCPDGYSHIFRF